MSFKKSKVQFLPALKSQVHGVSLDSLYENSEDVMKLLSGEKLRLIALAQTAYEEATFWSVKALTI